METGGAFLRKDLKEIMEGAMGICGGREFQAESTKSLRRKHGQACCIPGVMRSHVLRADKTGEEVRGHEGRGNRGQILEDIPDLWLLLPGQQETLEASERKRDLICLMS